MITTELQCLKMLVMQYNIYKQIPTVKCDVYVMMLNICYLCCAKTMYCKYIIQNVWDHPCTSFISETEQFRKKRFRQK